MTNLTEYFEPRPKKHMSRGMKALIGLSVVAAGIFAAGFAIPTPDRASNTGKQVAPKPETKADKLKAAMELQAAKASATANLTKVAITAATGILADIDKPTAGAISSYLYQGQYNLNNSLDLDVPVNGTRNPNYQYVPEMEAVYAPSMGLIAISAYTSTTITSGSNAGQKEYTDIEIAFSISPSSAFATNATAGQLTTSSFRSALQDPSLSLDSIVGEYNAGFNNSTKKGFNDPGEIGMDINNGKFYGSGLINSVDYLLAKHGITSALAGTPPYTTAGPLKQMVHSIDSTIPEASAQLSIYADNQLPKSAN